MSLLEEFIAAFAVPEIARPWLPMMIDEETMRVLVAMGGVSRNSRDVADLHGDENADTEDLLERCYSDGLVDKASAGGQTIYSPKDFLTFMPLYQRFGNLDDLPE